MADEDLRELERRWGETGLVEDEARLLQALVRARVISASDLRLAAYLEYPAACLACGEGAPTVPADVGEWVRGLEAWSADYALWAVAEAALEQAPEGSPAQAHYREVILRARERLDSGEPAGLDESALHPRGVAHAKVLRFALRLRANDWRYLPEDHPEVAPAKERAAKRFPWLDPQRWRYNHTERGDVGWTHALIYARGSGDDSWGRVPASSGWKPPENDFQGRPPGRTGVLDDLILSFSDPVAARQRIRVALLERVLRRGNREPLGRGEP